MKKLLLTITLFIGITANSQAQTDLCKDIKKDVVMTATIYTAPTPGGKILENSMHFSLSKFIGKTGVFTYLEVAYGSVKPNETSTNLIVTFEDNDQLQFSKVELEKEYKPSTKKYLYSTQVTLSSTDIEKLKTKKVASFTVAGNTARPYLSDFKNKIMAYAKCLDALTGGASTSTSATTSSNSSSTNTPIVEKKSIDGFWGIKFGASAAEVKATLAAKGAKFAPARSNAEKLAFDNVVFTKRRADVLSIRLINNKFYEALVNFPPSDETEILSKFNTIKSELSEVYGEEKLLKKFEQPYTEGDGYEVQAIKLGKAIYACYWETKNNNMIQLEIKKDLSISLFYTDTNLEKIADAKKSSDY